MPTDSRVVGTHELRTTRQRRTAARQDDAMVQFEYRSSQFEFEFGVDSPHIRHIGELAVSAARLEHLAAELAWELIDEDLSVGMAITAGMTFERLNSLIAKLIEKRLADDSDAAQHYRSVSKLAQEAMNERNRLLHGHWEKQWYALPDAGPDLITRTRKGELQVRMNVSVNDIRQVVGKLQAACTFFQLAQYSSWAELGRVVEFEPGNWIHRRELAE